MNVTPTREELFAMAAEPIGDRERLASGAMTMAEKAEAGRRAQKFWRPYGITNRSATKEARAAQAALRAAQIDLEDAIEDAGGERGSVRG